MVRARALKAIRLALYVVGLKPYASTGRGFRPRCRFAGFGFGCSGLRKECLLGGDSFPPRLKPPLLYWLAGTAEAVPLQAMWSGIGGGVGLAV